MRLVPSLLGLSALAGAAPSEFSSIQRRAVNTRVTLGDNYIDYGCDASIKKTLEEAFNKLCGENEVSCDSSQEYSREVDWTNGGALSQWPIKVKMYGQYPNNDIRAHIRSALKATVQDETWYNKDIRWGNSNNPNLVSISRELSMCKTLNLI